MHIISTVKKKEEYFMEKWKEFMAEEDGVGVVEVILILVEKPNAKHRYVLCGK